jgi:ribonuclease HII
MEAGRGCLAGPVTAAAALLPDNFVSILLNDIGYNVRKTEILRPVIEQESICFAVTHIEPKSDEINILNASMRQCKNAFEIKASNQSILDGNSPLIRKKRIANTSGMILHLQNCRSKSIPTSIIKEIQNTSA